MVVFTCNHCGDSLQKPKVQKHYETRCRNNYPDLCCVDCLKDFRGKEYEPHTKCVSEAERYGAKGFVPKASQNKGERKQNAWVELVQSVIEENKNIPGSLKYILEKISSQPNTPRKKPKFFNFMKSMDHRTSQRDIEQAWELLSSKLDLLKAPPKPTRQADNQNGESETPEKMEVDEETELNGVAEEDNGERKSEKKTKKSKKVKTEVAVDNSVVLENIIKKPGEEAMEINLETIIEPEKTLTKKELKEKKKRERYEAELKKVATEEKVEITTDDEARSGKKTKKRKLDEDEEMPNETEPKEETAISQENGELKEASGPKSKKKKEDHVVTFDWIATITEVLGAKDKDIPLKKLQKKVLTEYCVSTGTQEVTERITKKYTKSLYKIRNIKITNDKARLVVGEE